MPKLLIADDSMFQRFMHAKTAKDLGFDVLDAKDGQECLTVAVSENPDVILLDLNMPVLSGLEVLKAMKEKGIHSKILVITADIQDTTKQRCIDCGAVDFINKPVEDEILREKLQSLLS